MFRILIATFCLLSFQVKAQINQNKVDSLKTVIAQSKAEDKTEVTSLEAKSELLDTLSLVNTVLVFFSHVYFN